MGIDDLLLAAQSHQQLGLLTIVLLVERSMGKTKYGSIMGFVLMVGAHMLGLLLRGVLRLYVKLKTKKGNNDGGSTS